MSETQTAKEIAKLQMLRTLLLDNFIDLCNEGQLTPTDRRTLAALLKDNGMTIDPMQLPQSLRDRLAASLPIDDGLEEDAAI